MKYNFTQIFTFFTTAFLMTQGVLQAQVCDGTYVEENGLLVIEMESGILPENSNWQIGNEPDPEQPGETIDYLFWNGSESFNSLSNAIIRYDIRISNPGTYRILVRGRIGQGDLSDRHNDFWLNIEADDFFAQRRSNGQLVSTLGATPECDSNPDRSCADNPNNAEGFIKVFMNVTPTNGENETRVWRFVSNANNTEDGVGEQRNAHLLINATFDEAGDYAINIDARSSFFFMDKMVFFRDDVLRNTAQDLSNPSSTCDGIILSTTDQESINNTRVFPNPATTTITVSNLPSNSQGKFVLRNILGATVRELDINATNQDIDISDLKSGVYFISSLNTTTAFTKKFVKL